MDSVALGHASPKTFYSGKLTEGIPTIAAAFWPTIQACREQGGSSGLRRLTDGEGIESMSLSPDSVIDT